METRTTMYCAKCGAPLPADCGLCPGCGEKVSPSSRKKVPLWIKLLALVSTTILLGVVAFFFFRKSPQDTIRNQLRALHENKITEAYYRYTSRDFQKVTPFPSFREFIESSPIFSNVESFQVKDVVKEEEHVFVLVDLDGNERADVEYKLVREGGQWKVLSIRLQEEVSSTEVLVDLVQNHLKSLRKDDVLGAYEPLVSPQFQEETPLDEFRLFVAKYPIFTDHTKVEVKKSQSHGREGSVEVLLKTPDEVYSVEYKFVEGKDGLWKLWNLRLILPLDEAMTDQEADLHNLIAPVQDILERLRAGDLDGAYEATSQAFRKVTTLKSFKEFVERFPAFKVTIPATFKEAKLEGDKGKVEAEIQGERGTVSVFYTLAKNGNLWEIVGFEVNTEDGAEGLSEAILSVINAQLEAIRREDFKNAYNSFTAQDFQKATSFDAFLEFVKEHPVLSTYRSVDFFKLMFDNNIGTYEGNLVDPDGYLYRVEFDVALEEEEWKVLRIQVSRFNEGEI